MHIHVQVLCKESLSDKEMAQFRTLIDGSYRVHMMLDNLPAAAAHAK